MTRELIALADEAHQKVLDGIADDCPLSENPSVWWLTGALVSLAEIYRQKYHAPDDTFWENTYPEMEGDLIDALSALADSGDPHWIARAMIWLTCVVLAKDNEAEPLTPDYFCGHA